MIPLYGFLEGDTIGLLVLAEETDSMRDLAEKLQQAARVRVPHTPRVKVLFQGCPLDPATTVAQTSLGALDRFDVVRDG